MLATQDLGLALSEAIPRRPQAGAHDSPLVPKSQNRLFAQVVAVSYLV